MSFPLTCSSFEEGSAIPDPYTCEGDNLSPAFTWRDIPTGTRSLAMIAEDPDASSGTFTHWLLYNMPPVLTFLPEGLPKSSVLLNLGTQGYNDFHRIGYDGPCPPRGSNHRYYFHLYALEFAPTLPPDLTPGELRKAIQGHALGEASWVGRYGR
jgi:Raf kinase inhibitor-like YbhB/YbcL family protein